MRNTTTILCDYCQQPAQLVGGATIYPYRRDLHSLRFWHCSPCGAWVGCHPGTTKPLGRLADAELRIAKMEAHAAFDPRWRAKDKKNRPVARTQAYNWLAKQLGIERGQCHIGLFDIETCRRVVEICNAEAIR